jgi:biopolymer transport protein ExbD
MGRPLDQEEMDLTPMVDMTFLLLIFFMITASFSIQKSMEVPPPSSDQTGATQPRQSIDDLADSSIAVRIDDKNAIFIDDEPLPPSQRLSDALKQRFSAQKNELLLTADDAALHDTVVAVIDAANEIGVQKIRMTASPRD